MIFSEDLSRGLKRICVSLSLTYIEDAKVVVCPEPEVFILIGRIDALIDTKLGRDIAEERAPDRKSVV